MKNKKNLTIQIPYTNVKIKHKSPIDPERPYQLQRAVMAHNTKQKIMFEIEQLRKRLQSTFRSKPPPMPTP